MVSSSLSTLQHVTLRKLNKLDGQRQQFEVDKKSILEQVSSIPDHRSKVEALLDGFELHVLKHFVHQAKHDPSVSASLLKDLQSKLENELDVKSNKYEYAALFGKLVTEWIEQPTPVKMAVMSDGSISKGREEMQEQRQSWENYAFVKKEVDQNKIEEYLNDVFGDTLQAEKIKKSPLRILRDSMKNVMDSKSELDTSEDDVPLHNRFGHSAPYGSRFTSELLQSCIRDVKQADLFSGRKSEMLTDLEKQPAVLKELVDVLNMDLDGLDHWGWDGPVPLNMRRQTNGKYRVYMDEEIHQAILLHFIGKTWAVALKKAFINFYHSRAWLQAPYQSMPKKIRQRREHFIEKSKEFSGDLVRDYRRQKYQQEYFMTQLPSNAFEDAKEYDAGEGQEKNSHLATKQTMLRLLTTEMLLNTKVYGKCSVLQSDFKWFGPSLPHDTIFAVLKFFVVPAKWIRFFKRFLEVPVIFAQDGAGAKARVRKCGIPNSHILSDALGEAVLFCLDFAVNRRTKGANIHRFHDDLWFWGPESTSVQAWEAIDEFTKVMSLQLNVEKTGSSLIVADKSKVRAKHQSLPEGKLHWGFLELDASSGRWVIDCAQVDEHITELRRQLDACHSVMAWIQAWNSYVGLFFNTNFAQPANCFDRQHNDMIIETFSHIQRSFFGRYNTANVTEYLRSVLKQRFQVPDVIPDAFFYFPVELGGLGLKNPSISAFETYQNSFRDPGARIERAFEEERDAYDAAKQRWDVGDVPCSNREADGPFMSLEEYTAYREETSHPLFEAYTDLLKCPDEERLQTSDEVRTVWQLNRSVKLAI